MNIRWSKTINDSAGVVKAASEGFSCVELTVDHIMTINDEQFVLEKNLFQQYDIVPEVCASILPPDVLVTEKGFNLYAWTEYLKNAVHRLSELGCSKMVWNNGRARVLPVEGDKSEMKAQLRQFLHMLCEISGNYDMIILIEPLGPRKTNFLNSMDEVSRFIPLIPEDNLASVISLRELAEIGLKPEKFPEYSHLIKHVYMENPDHAFGKRIPPRPDDEYDYRSFLSALGEIHYEGVINLPEDADTETLKYCQSLI